jgi:hypothetical protein
MGLEAECIESAVDRAFGDSGFSSEGAGAPFGAAVAGIGLQRSVDHFGHLIVLIGAGTAGTQLVMQALNAELPVALSSFPYGCPCDAYSHCDRGFCFTSVTCQNYLGSLHEIVWH